MKEPTHAFSLVEVTLALGIVSFSLLSMLGLFSVGLQANQESARLSVMPQMVREMVHRAKAGPELPAVGESWTQSFNQEGIADAESHYMAVLEVKASGEPGWGVFEVTINYPGGSFVCQASGLIAP